MLKHFVRGAPTVVKNASLHKSHSRDKFSGGNFRAGDGGGKVSDYL